MEEGHLSALENFVQLTEPVFACDRDFLYSKLIHVFRVQKGYEYTVGILNLD